VVIVVTEIYNYLGLKGPEGEVESRTTKRTKERFKFKWGTSCSCAGGRALEEVGHQATLQKKVYQSDV